MTNQKNSIEDFLQSACRFVSTEQRAKDIQDELKDHIDSYIDEYIDKGICIEDATSKALKQMGDPNDLSLNFKDNISANKRLSIIILLISSMIISLSNIIYVHINKLDDFVGIGIKLTMFVFYICTLIIFIKTHIKSIELSKKEPIFYIQSRYNPHLKLLKLIIILPFIIIFVAFIVDLFSESNNELFYKYLYSFQSSTVTPLIFGIICCPPEIENNIIYPEGILTFKSFVPWVDFSP